MFESTGWVLVEPSNEDTSKYDNICPTVVSWTPERTDKTESGIFDSTEDSVEGANVMFLLKFKNQFMYLFQYIYLFCFFFRLKWELCASSHLAQLFKECQFYANEWERNNYIFFVKDPRKLFSPCANLIPLNNNFKIFKLSKMSSYDDPFSYFFLVPHNHNQILEEYTRQGFRVIALAHRLVEIRSIHKLQKVQREELEHDLTFLGIYIYL